MVTTSSSIARKGKFATTTITAGTATATSPASTTRGRDGSSCSASTKKGSNKHKKSQHGSLESDDNNDSRTPQADDMHTISATGAKSPHATSTPTKKRRRSKKKKIKIKNR